MFTVKEIETFTEAYEYVADYLKSTVIIGMFSFFFSLENEQ